MGKKSENGKNAPAHNPRYRASAKISFIIVISKLLIDVNKMRVKNITVTVSVRVCVTVSVSLVLFVCITVSFRVSAMVWVSLV